MEVPAGMAMLKENPGKIAADLRAEADRLHEEMRRLQDQADALLNLADDLDLLHRTPEATAVVGLEPVGRPEPLPQGSENPEPRA
jgi:hypothetical protein